MDDIETRKLVESITENGEARKGILEAIEKVREAKTPDAARAAVATAIGRIQDTVGPSDCEAQCETTYHECTAACPPNDTSCINRCFWRYMQCVGNCQS